MDLPIELMMIIITNLPLLDAFQLCLVRKEWFQLWKYYSSVELHEVTFSDLATRQHQLNVGQRVRSLEMKAMGKRRFMEFFNRTVSQITSPVLSKFSFRMVYAMEYDEQITQWINIAMSKSVEELSLLFSDGDPLRNQPALYTPIYVSPPFFLPNLSLNLCCLGHLCNFQGFMGLRSLTFTRLTTFMGDIENVITNYLVLEVLTLVECYQLIKLEICYIMLRLQRLIVRNCDSLSLRIKQCLPRLQYFEYAGNLIRFNLKQLDGLEEVVLDYQIDAYFPYQFEEFRDIVSGFSQARTLTICISVLKARNVYGNMPCQSL